MRGRWSAFVVVGALGVGAVAGAAPLDPKKAPAPLAPWVSWVLRGHEAELCPAAGDEHRCAWSGRLTLLLDGKGGRFSQDWEVLAPTAVPLPGDARRWPLDVKAGGKLVPV